MLEESQSKVYLVEPHPATVLGLRQILEPEYPVVGRASEAAQALKQAPHLKPDLVVSAFNLADVDGLILAASLRAEGFKAKILLLSGSLDSGVVYSAFRAGDINGIVPKTATTKEIKDGVRAVLRGDSYVSPALASDLATKIRNHAPLEGVTLNERETEMLFLMAGGFSQRDIAQKLLIAESTVKTHCRNAYSKLGVRGAPAAVAKALRRRLIV